MVLDSICRCQFCCTVKLFGGYVRLTVTTQLVLCLCFYKLWFYLFYYGQISEEKEERAAYGISDFRLSEYLRKGGVCCVGCFLYGEENAPLLQK